jgi:predicted MFS family arabinose efflux permease
MIDGFRTSVLFSRERLLLLILAMVQLTNVLDFVVMMPLGPQFMRHFSISPQAFGMMVSSYTFSAAVFGFLGAFFIDRFDRRVALLMLYAGFTLGTFCCALAPTYELLTLARSLAGAFGGIMGAVVMAIVGDAFPEARRGAATGVIMSSFSVASIVGVPFGLYLAHLLSWQAPFFMLAALSAVTWLGAFYLLPPLTQHLHSAAPVSPIAEMRLVLSFPNTLRAFAFMGALMLAGFSVIPFISPYMVGNVGLSESDLPYIYLFGGLATFFTSRYVGVLSDRYGKKLTFQVVALCSIVPILLLTSLPSVPVFLALAVTTLFMVLISGRFVPAVALVNSSVVSRHRGSFMSLTASVQQLSSGLASFLAGLVIGKGHGQALTNYWVVGIIASLMTLLCIWLAEWIKPAELSLATDEPATTAPIAEGA